MTVADLDQRVVENAEMNSGAEGYLLGGVLDAYLPDPRKLAYLVRKTTRNTSSTFLQTQASSFFFVRTRNEFLYL